MDELLILQNSIERTINTTLHILEQLKAKGHLPELISINLKDWQELKWPVVGQILYHKLCGTKGTSKMDKQDELKILQNSIERTINTTIQILEQVHAKGHLNELISINLQDWRELKWPVVEVWNEKRNKIFTERNK